MTLAQVKALWSWKVVGQILFLIVMIAIGTIAQRNLARNLQQLGLPFSFDFLNSQASFNIREQSIPYQPSDSYSRAILVGLLNTIKVTLSAIAIASVVGITVGISRLSDNWLLRQIATVYVELLRNIPLLLLLFFCYTSLIALPQAPVGSNVMGIFKDGFHIPGQTDTLFSSEFCALVLGLSLYTAAFIAEIVRGGINAVSKGQWEAAKALGLSSGLVMRLVIFPQALRTIIPPLTGQFLNITKNSSLAVAIGYEDVYSLASTTFNQTGRSIEVILLLMAVYLALSSIIALAMNFWNSRVKLA
jgi:general L-amino acid transport system permease protein